MNPEPKKIIGIIGGVGPLAGLDLAAKITANTRAGGDRDHLPFVLASLPGAIGDRSDYLLGRSKVNPADGLIAALRRLHAAGASVAAIPCNTAHAPAIFGQVAEEAAALGLELVNMLAETAGHLAGPDLGKPLKVAVLSTLGTWETGVYRDYLAPAGLGHVDLGREQMEKVHQAIYHPEHGLKSRADGDFSRARRMLEEVLDHCRERGLSTVVLGCTELPLALAEKESGGLKLVDPTNILARALVRRAAPDKLADD